MNSSTGTVRVRHLGGTAVAVYVERPDGRHVAVYVGGDEVTVNDSLHAEVPEERGAETVWTNR